MITEKIFSGKSDVSFTKSVSSEKPIRSVVKAVSWRVIGTVDTLLVSWYATGNLSMASSIASIDFVTKMILYFFHERAWNSIKWGKND
ncbi:DUF2061 domain-containing protein [Wenyingzhuangia sp. 2_MG-2023]|uniref:DUF2061 domain-containing protein n=1 Tax=Wenyingzhuangia sp. 2_MG-2023 TaxID=3062639 RepID=UPI0026E42C64|nr:DUF2061 domain-containing protein [Wenyingzhuangia sp. 2_MG-2023]MDO6737969.1 DUF2061 domain-containing protein [Wenyingzhuangia sp. 2_MG-2023]MDO6802677.1 DUF2061 domain-containing protein [Wenyingzhuangia sp. 1_MG-2023]